MTDIIVLIVLAAIIGRAVSYMVKAKKSGVKCIGCPAGGSCSCGGKMPKRSFRLPEWKRRGRFFNSSMTH